MQLPIQPIMIQELISDTARAPGNVHIKPQNAEKSVISVTLTVGARWAGWSISESADVSQTSPFGTNTHVLIKVTEITFFLYPYF